MPNKKTILLVVTFILFSSCFAACFNQGYVSKPTVVHSVDEGNLKLLWSRDDVYTLQDDFRSATSAGGGLLCILGDVVHPPEKEISCMDGDSGDVAWQKAPGNATDILVAYDSVYVAYSGVSGIEKYDYQGNLIWSRSLTGTGITYFYLYNNTIQLFMNSIRFLILNAETGAEIESTKGTDVILETSTETFSKNSFFESRDLNSSNVNWSLEIGSSVSLKPLFKENNIFLKTERTIGSVLAVDRQTGVVIWRTERDVISNVVYLPETNQIVVLTRNGVLVAVDVINGKQAQLVQFSNPPFFLNGEENVGGYELTFDESNNILFVLLGDSRQLFTFQLK